MKVAVIGGGGQIGAVVVRHLAGNGVSALAICRNDVTAGPLRASGLEVRVGSVADDAAGLLGDRDVVINLSSATALPGTARREDRAVIRSILSMTPTPWLVHFSSVAVNGSCIDPRHTSFERPFADSAYALEKLALERFALAEARARRARCTVVRLGHVYGAEQWLSRHVLLAAQRPGFALPFDGARRSNAVHVRNVAAGLRALIAAGAVDQKILNLFDSPQSTWREIFDWNTRAVGQPPVPAMSASESERRFERHRAAAARPLGVRVARELGAWARTLPGAMVASSPSLKTLGLALLARLQSAGLERRAMGFVAGTRVVLASDADPAPEPWLYGHEAQGPAIAFASERGDAEAAQVARWYRGWSDPSSILDGVDDNRAGVGSSLAG